MNEIVKITLIGEDPLVLEDELSFISDIDGVSIELITSSRIIEEIVKFSQHDNSIAIINLSKNGINELQALRQVDNKKAIIVLIGEPNNIDLLSQAIRTGIRDYINYNEYKKELYSVILRIKKDLSNTNSSKNARIIAVVNAKGGSGASFIASNIAAFLARKKNIKTLLADFDLQFGTIGFNFEMVPKYTINDVLSSIDNLDSESLQSYISKYNDNLSLLLPSDSNITFPGEIVSSDLKQLIMMLKKNYDQIIIDLPKIIDPLSTVILDQADQIALVIQQGLVDFRNVLRLVKILNKELDIPIDKICIVINRYDSKNRLQINDYKKIINYGDVFTITNDFERVINATDRGIPLFNTPDKYKIFEDLGVLAKNLTKLEYEKEDNGIFQLVRKLFS
jgi:pilus assembly protein CpaE